MLGEPILTEENKDLSAWRTLHAEYMEFRNNIDDQAPEMEQHFSEKIRRLLLKISPDSKENLDQMFFSFDKDYSSIVLLIRLKNDNVLTSRENNIGLSVNRLSPLIVESLFFILKQDCPNKWLKYDNFVEFIESFDPKTLTNLPPKKHMNILSKWFVENVDWNVSIKNENKDGAKLRVLTWRTAQRPKKYKKAIIPESTTIQEIASVILSTGTLKTIKPQKFIDKEFTDR